MGDNNDKLVDGYLGGKSDLSGLYGRADQPEPPASLDKEILEAARSEVRPGGRASGPFGAKWYVPVSLAAVLVLTVGVVVTLEKETGEEAGLIQEYKPVARPAPERPITTSKQKRAATSRPAAPAETKADHPAPAAVPQKTVEQKIQKAVEEAPQSGVLQQEPAKRELLRDRAAPEPMQEETPASATEATDDNVQLKEKIDTVNKPAGAANANGRVEPEKPAAQWLESIRLLLEQGQVEEAKRQYVDFRHQYPDYPVDSALKDSLK